MPIIQNGTEIALAFDSLSMKKGTRGIVKAYFPDTDNYAVEFPSIIHGHSCGGITAKDKGFWLMPSQIIVISEPNVEVCIPFEALIEG